MNGRCLTVCLLAALGITHSRRAHAEEEAEVIVADRLRTAFYEQAPRNLRRLMEKAVAQSCEELRSGKKKLRADVKPGEFWICGAGPRLYFREVLINGYHDKMGVVCPESFGSWKYVPPEEINPPDDSAPCVVALYDDDSRSYSLVLEDYLTE